MNGMRKVGHKSAVKAKEALDESDELDFNQDLEDLIEGKQKVDEAQENNDKQNPLFGNDSIHPENKIIQDILQNLNENSKKDNTNLTEEINNIIKSSPTKVRLHEDLVLDSSDLESLSQMDNRSVSSIEEYEQIQQERNQKTVYVKNVDYSSNPQELELHFKECGEITRISILVDKYTGLPKGYAFIEFSTLDGKDKAKLMTDSIFKGQQIKVEDKRKKVPDYYERRTKKNKTPVYSTDMNDKGGSARYGPIKGRFSNSRNFKPY